MFRAPGNIDGTGPGEAADQLMAEKMAHDFHYPLQGSGLDYPLETVLAFTKKRRRRYIQSLLALGREIQSDTMALKNAFHLRKKCVI